ncbi:telomere length and silencing protein 1 homolog [Maniola jurtina]|uniref:telomere length and silencing protein 1 homolog n=1 Tax=Maniola jurtina TaxID=191418 RepID=UPI001E68CC82|nr:telomere length and silencing protein 1 homolog [Maniola jurtina]XP_045778399.1 telomere length and silencing protein 1 homolog [Maniola jurtina]
MEDAASKDAIEEEIKFRPKKKKNLRQRVKLEDEESEDEEVILARLEEAREIQKLRERPNGISVVALATGQKTSLVEEVACKDPYNVKAGGMVNMQALKSGKVKQVDDAYDTGIGTQFSAETNKRDEDEEMMKYIEEQLAKRKEGHDQSKKDCDDSDTLKYFPPEEAALLSLPEHLRVSSTHRSEEMLSNQMLSGIPEVDLGIDAKIKNIEATEEAKMKLLWERHNKKDGPSQFVPTNMAVNFVQHNRFNLDSVNAKKRKVEKPESQKTEASVIDESVNKIVKKAKGERATDDYHYEKFRKQFRRY